jgi:hypothetical protein
MTASPPRPWYRRAMILTIVALFIAPIVARSVGYALSQAPRSWRDANWSSTRLLPPAERDAQARVMMFTGTTGGWKGVLAVHSWVVLKPANATQWTRYDVVGWGNPVRINNWAPDGRWYGNIPTVIADLRGIEAETLIPKIENAIKKYRFGRAGDYRIWPGPNSNTFTAAVLRAVPELKLALPSNAIGRDFRDGFYAGLTDSRTGIEINVWGILTAKIGWVEGLEINILGLVAGLDLRHPGIKLPAYGRLGWDGSSAAAVAGPSRISP